MTQTFLDHEELQLLKAATDALAMVCDGAKEADHMGFNAVDTATGHLFAALPVEEWPPSAIIPLAQMMKKYRKQLNCIGLDLDQIAAKGAKEEKKYIPVRFIIIHQSFYWLIFPYNPYLIKRCKSTLTGAHFKSKPINHWKVPQTEANSNQLRTLVAEGLFDVSPSLFEHVEQNMLPDIF